MSEPCERCGAIHCECAPEVMPNAMLAVYLHRIAEFQAPLTELTRAWIKEAADRLAQPGEVLEPPEASGP